jgi:6-pyruvoyltetrahydropterin/6-carboxytetrahydropterin synthase
MMLCARRIQFCAGHRVWNHESKCAHLHGHNYVAVFYATATQLDALGRVIDFSELKSRLGGWVDTYWDHGFVLHEDDLEALEALKKVAGQKLYTLKANPTVENLADYLLRTVAPRELADTGVQVVKIVLWETENCCAEVSLET